MTPELKTACELVFQEHKISGKPISWNKDSFRGRLSFGLSAMAKQTLEGRNIIHTVSPAKKTVTVLNPAAASAASFEEAEEIMQNKPSVLVAHKTNERPEYIAHHVPGFVNSKDNSESSEKRSTSITIRPTLKWWIKPLFYYAAFLVCAAAAGALITYLLGLLIS
jgi:hypothetical protein